MKHFILSTLFTLLLPLAACTEKDISGGEPPVGPQTGLRLSARLSQGVVTRALGDPFAAQLEEKRIDRLAFFVHTKEDGFQVYPPVPDDVTDPDQAAADHPNAVYLAGTPATGYTATVALTAGGGYVADIIAIANLPADYDYRQIVTWEGLQDTVAILATKMPACLPGSAETDLSKRNAFVMYGDVTKELKKEETNTLSFSLQRLVARIDITNEAYEPGTTPANAAANPENSFFLTSARLLRAQPAAYLVPKPDRTPDVVTTDVWPALTGIGTDILYGKPTSKTPTADPTQEPEMVTVTTPADANNARLQYAWHTLYTYPNSDTEHAPTALEIKGTFRGTEITRRIPFVNKDGAAFPVEGNHRYLVRIMKAPGQTDISFNIAVSEWDAVDTVNVKPDQTEVPVITNLATNLTEYTNSEGQKAYDLFYTQNGEMTFEATCRFAAGVRIKYYDEKSETWTTQGNWLKVEQVGEAEVTTKANNAYKISYKITCDKFDGGRTRKAMLLVHNGGSEVECDTMIIRHVITYPGTDLEGIEVEDPTGAASTVTWAPVNVGATRIATDIKPGYDYDTRQPIPLSEEDQQSNFEQCGYLFQWGRKTPFKFPGCDEMMKNTIEFSTLDEFPTYEEGISPDYEYYDKYIIRNSSVNYYYWYKDHGFNSAPLSPILANKMLWPRQSDPCPVGWHVPSNEDSQSLINMLNSDGTASNHWIVQSSTIANLVFPHAGRIHVYGEGRFMSDSGVYWLSTVKADEISPPILAFSFNSAKLVNVGWALCFSTTAIPVRCVQDPIP